MKRVGQFLLALLFSFVFIPLISYITIIGYDNLINSFGNNIILLIAYACIAVLVVLFVMSLLIKFLNDKFEVPLIYHIIIGIITIVVLVWLILYSKTNANAICDIAIFGNSSSLCVKYLKNEQTYFVYAIYSAACYGMFIVLSLMEKKKKH